MKSPSDSVQRRKINAHNKRYHASVIPNSHCSVAIVHFMKAIHRRLRGMGTNKSEILKYSDDSIEASPRIILRCLETTLAFGEWFCYCSSVNLRVCPFFSLSFFFISTDFSNSYLKFYHFLGVACRCIR